MKKFELPSGLPVTQKILKSLVPKLYDPLGICIVTQLLGRDILRKSNEDLAGVPEELIERFLKEVERIVTTPFPRRVPITKTLICCCDASASAFAVLVFNEEGQLIQGRGSLGSRPPQTIPREELNAMVLGAETAANVLSDLRIVFPQPVVERILILLDSLINIQRLRRFRRLPSLGSY
jgi:hypothetical protein